MKPWYGDEKSLHTWVLGLGEAENCGTEPVAQILSMSDYIFVPCVKCKKKIVEVPRDVFETPVCDFCLHGDDV